MLTRVKFHLITLCALVFALMFSVTSAAVTPTHSTTVKKTHHAEVSTIKKTTSKKKSTKKSAKKKSTVKGKAAAPAIATATNIQDGVDQILSKYSNLKNGVIIQSADTGAVLYQYNSNQTFTPASTLKLFTAVAALTYLTPNFVFKTQLLTNGPVRQNGELWGDLYVKFGGDPELTIPALNELIVSLEKQGICHIHGNLIIDDFDMDHANMGPGWLPKEQTLCYAAPSNAIVLNRNCFGFAISPAKQSGSPVQIKVQPNIANLSFINETMTQSSRGTCPPLTIKAHDNNTYALTGCIAPRRATMSVGVALSDTRAAGTNVVINLLRQNDIVVTGSVLYGKAAPNLRLLAERDSRPVSALITKMLKKSDNLIAGSLFKKLGGTYFNTTGTWQNGAQAVRAILAPKTGIDFDKMVLVDGAGLSREDQVSPAQFGKLLYYAYRMQGNAIFYQALPSSGIDGTLRGRLGGSLAGKVHAKTGTIDNRSGLAGYIQSVNHGNLIFAILVNDFVNTKSKQSIYRLLEDRICQFVGTTSGPVSRPTVAATPPVSSPPSSATPAPKSQASSSSPRASNPPR